MYRTYRRQELHHGITWLSTDAQPILYPVHAPFDALVRVVGFDPRSVNTQEFDGFRVPPLSLVDCDKVKDSVMSDAMYGESQTDGHGGRIDLCVVTCHPSSRSNSQYSLHPLNLRTSIENGGKITQGVRSKRYRVIDSRGSGCEYRYWIFFVSEQLDVLPLGDLNIREIEFRMGGLELGKGLW
jgi:hypothetical protein